MITPYRVDHSAFDSHAFLIESENKRIFYSGDFRGHGRKSEAYKWFLGHAPQNIDYLLMEGSQIGRKNDKIITEEDIQKELTSIFSKETGPKFVFTSSQNIDRLVSVFKACIKTNHILVLDIYSANVLHTLSQFANLPDPLNGFININVMFPYRTTKMLFDRNKKSYAKKFKPFYINKKIISKNPDKYVILVRPSMQKDIDKIQNFSEGVLIYSLWSGYKSKPNIMKFLDYMQSRNIKIIDCHTSGHAYLSTLQEFTDALQPKHIIPIHTFHKQQYKNLFNYPVLELDDKELLKF